MKNKILILSIILTMLFSLVSVFSLTAAAEESGAWTLVTDASTLKAGDKIVIVASEYDYAISTTQNTNNRGQAEVTKNGNTVTFGDDVQILTLEAGKVDGSFGLNTGSGYLRAAGTSNKTLKTNDTLDNYGSWKITISSAGVATIKAQGDNANNWLRYNKGNNPPLFSAYASGQSDVSIYKWTVGGSTTPEQPGEGSDPVTPPATTDYSGKYYIATKRTSGNYFYMTSDLGTAGTKRYQAVDSDLTALPASITSAEDGYVFVLEKNSDGTYKIYADGVIGDNYLGWTSGNSGILVSENDAVSLTVDANTNGSFNIHFTTSDGERYLALNGTAGNDYFAFYKNGQAQDICLVTVSGEGNTPEQPGGEDPEQPGGEDPEQPGGEDPEQPGDDPVTPPVTTDYSGKYYVATKRTSGNYFYMTSDLGTASTKRYQAVDSGLTTLPASISEADAALVFVLVKNSDGTYKIYAEGVKGDNYLGWSSGNSGILVSEAEAKSFTVTENEGAINIFFTSGEDTRYLSLNSDADCNYFAFYKGTQSQNLTLVKVTSVSDDDIDVPGDNEQPDQPEQPEQPDQPDQPEQPENKPEDKPSDDEPEEKLNFFQKIWRAILNFFKKLFGKK